MVKQMIKTTTAVESPKGRIFYGKQFDTTVNEVLPVGLIAVKATSLKNGMQASIPLLNLRCHIYLLSFLRSKVEERLFFL